MRCAFRFLTFLTLAWATTLPASVSLAAVTFFGSVNPDPPGDGNVESTLSIGVAGDDNPDLQGYVLIDGGSQIEYDMVIVGDDEDYRGELVILGEVAPGGQSRLTLEESGTVSNAAVQVGRQGVGQLTVANGGSLILSNASGDLAIGLETSGVGTLTVAGAFSLVAIPDGTLIGGEGIGRMEILDGGMVLNSDATNTAVIGATLTGSGSVLVDGPGSIWKINDNLTIGDVGLGSLRVSNQGLIDADRLAAETLVGARGRLELDGGTFAGTEIFVDGYLGGSGLVRGEVLSSVGAIVDVPAGGLLQFGGDVSNQGSLRVAGEAVFLGALNNFSTGLDLAPGRITMESGRLRFSQPLFNDGVIAVTSGVNDLHGEVVNGDTGAIVIASNTVATFYDAVDIGGGSLELLAGANALFLADLVFDSASAAALQIGDADTGPAQIHVSGAAALAGGLDVTLAGGFAPSSGDSFPLLLASEGVVGDFDALALPVLDSGLFWGVDYSANSVVLNVLASLVADFDADGDVDQDDLVGTPDGWQSRYGSDLDGSDFLTWQRQLGSGVPNLASSQAVPEPATFLYALVGLGGFACLRRHNDLR